MNITGFRSDSGYLLKKDDFPMSAAYFGDVSDDGSSRANFTVGRLICYGKLTSFVIKFITMTPAAKFALSPPPLST